MGHSENKVSPSQSTSRAGKARERRTGRRQFKRAQRRPARLVDWPFGRPANGPIPRCTAWKGPGHSLRSAPCLEPFAGLWALPYFPNGPLVGHSENKGFSLIELLIVLSIIAVLAVIATVSYSQYIIRANRTEAKTELLELAQKQERYFSNSQPVSYAKDFVELGRLPEGSTQPGSFITDSGNFRIDMQADQASFFITATAVSPRQLKDAKCRQFSINQQGKEEAHPSDDPNKDNSQECWSR
ncbi:MAG: type IV pilin protein [Thiotrichales bacterium]